MFALNPNSLPTIRSYEAALNFWKAAEPHKDPRFRQLHPRRRNDTSKAVWSPDDGKTIHFRYHHTDVVTYTKNSILVRTWHSRSTCIFANELLPNSFHCRMNLKGYMLVNEIQPVGDSLCFRKRGDSWQVVKSQAKPQFQTVVDRKKAAAVRKKYKPYLQWHAAAQALIGQRIPRWAPQARHFDLTMLHGVHQPSMYPRIFERFKEYPAEGLLQRALVAHRAVKKVRLPIGVMPRPSIYDHI